MTTEAIKNKAEIAFRTLLAHSQKADVENADKDEQIQALLCDLMHLADQYAVDFDKEVENAKAQYARDAIAPAT